MKYLLLGLFSCVASIAYADRAPISIVPIVIKNAPSGKNLAITVFYASGSNPSIAASGTVPYIRTLMASSVRADIHGDGTAQIPRTQITPNGFEIPNVILLVIHSANQRDVKIENPDGKIATADGPVDPTNVDSDSVDNVRIVPLQISLNESRTGVDSVLGNSAQLQGGSIVVDLAAP